MFYSRSDPNHQHVHHHMYHHYHDTASPPPHQVHVSIGVSKVIPLFNIFNPIQ